jgi:hypothetical protein
MFSLGAKRLDKLPPSPNNAVSSPFINNLESYSGEIKEKGGRLNLAGI